MVVKSVSFGEERYRPMQFVSWVYLALVGALLFAKEP